MLDKGERMRRFCEAISLSAANVYLYAYLYFRILILICIFICIFVFLSVFVQDKRCLTKENKWEYFVKQSVHLVEPAVGHCTLALTHHCLPLPPQAWKNFVIFRETTFGKKTPNQTRQRKTLELYKIDLFEISAHPFPQTQNNFEILPDWFVGQNFKPLPPLSPDKDKHWNCFIYSQ